MVWNKLKNSEIQMFQIQGDAYFRADLKRQVHKILMLKSNFKWSVENLSGVLLLFKISRNLVESKPSKTCCEFVFF